jgi:pimeloyl-ACP methyl ester carboxylesterase
VEERTDTLLPAAEHTEVRVNGLTLHALAWGRPNHPVVVLLHGGSAHAHWWDFVAPALADRYRVIAPDLRGHGDSEHVRPPAYAIDDYVADLEGLAAACGLARFALVGHSLGGFVAMRYAGRHSPSLAALAVVDSRPVSGSGRSGLVNRLRHLPHPRYADREDAVRRFRLLPAGTSAAPEVLRHMALAGLTALPEGGFTLKFDRQAFAARERLDLNPALAGLRCPVLFVRGSESTFLDAETLRSMQALCARAESAEIAGAHHHVMLDRPAAFTARLAAFLDATVGRAR